MIIAAVSPSSAEPENVNELKSAQKRKEKLTGRAADGIWVNCNGPLDRIYGVFNTGSKDRCGVNTYSSGSSRNRQMPSRTTIPAYRPAHPLPQDPTAASCYPDQMIQAGRRGIGDLHAVEPYGIQIGQDRSGNVIWDAGFPCSIISDISLWGREESAPGDFAWFTVEFVAYTKQERAQSLH